MRDISTAVVASSVSRGVPTDEYDVDVIDTRSALQASLPEWREFIATNPRGSSLFNDPVIIDADLAGEAAAPLIVQIRRRGELQCIAPFSIRSARLPIQFSVYTLARCPLQLLNLYGTDLVFAADADTQACCGLAFDSIRDATFDLGLLYSLDSNGGLSRYFTSTIGKSRRFAFQRRYDHFDKCFHLQLPETFAEYLSTLGSSTRGTLKRRTKKLQTIHAARLKKVTAPDEVPEFLQSVTAIYSDAWQSKTYGQVQRDRPAEIQRLQSIAQEGWLRSYLLESDEGPLAFQIGYQYRDTFYACDFAFARKWAELGPGAVLMYLMLEDLFNELRPQVVDLGAGDSPQKHTFRGAAFDVGDYWVMPPNRWRHVARAQRYLTRIESNCRSLLTRTNLDKAVRRLLKHKK